VVNSGAPMLSKRVSSSLDKTTDFQDTLFITVTALCSGAAVFGLVAAGVCWYRLHRRYKSAEEAEYPQYGVTGPAKQGKGGRRAGGQTTGDDKLASSAHLYHYQHTKQQIIAMEQPEHEGKGGAESEDSEGEGDDADYSVYECPGLAPTGDIEVSNPLFQNAGLMAQKSAAGPPTEPPTKED